MIQMARELQHALRVACLLAEKYESTANRIWFPHISWAWLGVQVNTLVLEERGNYVWNEDDEHTSLSPGETRQGFSERSPPKPPSRDEEKAEARLARAPKRWWIRLMAMFPYWWNYPQMLKTRLSVSHALKSVHRSPHLRHGLKNAAGVALLGVPAFLSNQSKGTH
jgi:hypothetical protein